LGKLPQSKSASRGTPVAPCPQNKIAPPRKVGTAARLLEIGKCPSISSSPLIYHSYTDLFVQRWIADSTVHTSILNENIRKALSLKPCQDLGIIGMRLQNTPRALWILSGEVGCHFTMSLDLKNLVARS
jgi:hypothetical protein